MSTFLFYALSLLTILILLPLASQMSQAMHESRRAGSSGMQVLTSVFYTKKPQLVHEQVSRQAKERQDLLKKTSPEGSDTIVAKEDLE